MRKLLAFLFLYTCINLGSTPLGRSRDELLLSGASLSGLSPSGFEATVNGQVVRYEDLSESTSYKPGIMALELRAGEQSTGGGKVEIEILNFAGPGTYRITNGSTARAVYEVTGEEYSTDLVHTGYVTVTSYDALRQSVEGTASFVAADRIGRTIELRDGRFWRSR